jgi:hypothetical protein
LPPRFLKTGEVELVNKPEHGIKISLRLPITNTLLTKQAIMLKLINQTFSLTGDGRAVLVLDAEPLLH